MANEGKLISEISPAVSEFVRKHIDSVHQLELLLLLKRYSDRAWTASELARELYTSAHSCEDNLKKFAAAGLVEVVHHSSNESFRYAAKEDDQQITDLMQAYKNYRVRVIDTIFSKTSNSLKHFSDAFKFTKDKEQP